MSESVWDKQCSDENLHQISKLFADWKAVAPELGLTETDEVDIVGYPPSSVPAQRTKMMRTWSQRKGEKATYRNLEDTFTKCGRQDVVALIKKLVSQASNASLGESESSLCSSSGPSSAQLNSGSEDRPPSPKRSKRVPNTCTEPEHGGLDVPEQKQTSDATDEGYDSLQTEPATQFHQDDVGNEATHADADKADSLLLHMDTAEETSKRQRVTIEIGKAKIPISLLLLDKSKPILKFMKKRVPAPFFPKICKCTDDKDLVILARDELEHLIEQKYESKRREELKYFETPVSDTQTSFSADTAANCQTQQETSFDLESSLPTEETNNAANSRQKPTTKALKKAAVSHYEKTHPDVAVKEMSTFLFNSTQNETKRISGKPQYRLLQRTDSAPVGLIHLEIVKRPKNRQELETDDVYHVIQALLYVGGKNGYKYFDYIQHGLGKEDVFAPIPFEPDDDWKTKNIDKAFKFCEYFDEMWDYLKQQYSKAEAQSLCI